MSFPSRPSRRIRGSEDVRSGSPRNDPCKGATITRVRSGISSERCVVHSSSDSPCNTQLQQSYFRSLRRTLNTEEDETRVKMFAVEDCRSRRAPAVSMRGTAQRQARAACQRRAGGGVLRTCHVDDPRACGRTPHAASDPDRGLLRFGELDGCTSGLFCGERRALLLRSALAAGRATRRACGGAAGTSGGDCAW